VVLTLRGWPGSSFSSFGRVDRDLTDSVRDDAGQVAYLGLRWEPVTRQRRPQSIRIPAGVQPLLQGGCDLRDRIRVDPSHRFRQTLEQQLPVFTFNARNCLIQQPVQTRPGQALDNVRGFVARGTGLVWSGTFRFPRTIVRWLCVC